MLIQFKEHKVFFNQSFETSQEQEELSRPTLNHLDTLKKILGCNVVHIQNYNIFNFKENLCQRKGEFLLLMLSEVLSF